MKLRTSDRHRRRHTFYIFIYIHLCSS